MHRWSDGARDDARAILHAILDAASPRVVARKVARDGDALVLPDGTRVRLASREVRLAAVGKAAGGMAAHAQHFGPFAEAVVVAPHDAKVPDMECLVGDHPTPTERSVRAGERLLELARATPPDGLLILLLSGGASALAEAPAVPLADLARANDLLLKSDAPIGEINVVRRHLSRLKGGRLAQACRGEMVVLGISDVPRDDAAALGSGPATADATTFGDALRVLRSRDILDAAPASVREHLEAGARGEVPETLKPGDAALARVHMHVLTDNDDAVRAGAREAASRGYETRALHGHLQGEARARGAELAALAREEALRPGPPLAVVAGGETVVRVLGQGKGGRNQEAALAAVDGLSALDAVLACFGTDGVDGPTDAAGAIVDGYTLARAQAEGLDARAHLEENDAYPFFDRLHDLIRTGPTGTNVRDVALLLVRRGA